MAQKKNPVQTHYLVTESYLMTRGAALHFPAKQFSDMITDEHSVYGMVIDIPIDPRTLSTLVVYINGAANLYFNNGGSYTGASQRYQTVVQAGRLLVANAPRILAESEKTDKFPLPTGQPHNIYLLTKGGIYEKTVLPTAIKEESADMQAVYFLYQQVMRELRSAQLKDRAAAQAKK
ncbi:MAG: hypothetical protein ACI4XB_06670 [Ruminococcus sp.]|uniref:hypothetical protein n=1 Tax=uncultured Ruminococcus sp. TaxID=165186 RepID=UPI00260C296F|nr:hypothetical protein [uncultured Ruminococcus sp.]